MLLVDRAAIPDQVVHPISSSMFAVMDVERGALPAGTLAVWVCLGGLNGVTVSEYVPDGSVAAVLRHLRGHVSAATAQALGLVICNAADCPIALDWLEADDDRSASSTA